MDDLVTAKCAGGLEAIVSLFGSASPMTMSHWNVGTGEIFHVRRGKRHRDRVQAFEERLFDEEGWHEVPFQESDDAYAMAMEFVDELRPGKARVQLRLALEGEKPFRRFRDGLKKFAGVHRRYNKVVAEEALGRLVVFCLANSLRIDDPRFAASSRELERQFLQAEKAAPVLAMASLSIGSKAT